jgi:hypothetical protein
LCVCARACDHVHECEYKVVYVCVFVHVCVIMCYVSEAPLLSGRHGGGKRRLLSRNGMCAELLKSREGACIYRACIIARALSRGGACTYSAVCVHTMYKYNFSSWLTWSCIVTELCFLTWYCFVTVLDSLARS